STPANRIPSSPPTSAAKCTSMPPAGGRCATGWSCSPTRIEPNRPPAVYWHMRYLGPQPRLRHLRHLLLACLIGMATAGSVGASAADYNLPGLGEATSNSNYSLPAPAEAGDNNRDYNLPGLGESMDDAGSNSGGYNLPSLGEPANNTMSLREEKRIGGRIFSQFLRAGHVLEDPELRDYITRIGKRLVNASSHSPGEFRFFVVKSPVINAFALPGGYVGINAGLILATQSESELAGVLAHEISHVTQRHIARQIAATKGMKWATLAGMLGMAIAGGGDPDDVQAAITGG